MRDTPKEGLRPLLERLGLPTADCAAIMTEAGLSLPPSAAASRRSCSLLLLRASSLVFGGSVLLAPFLFRVLGDDASSPKGMTCSVRPFLLGALSTALASDDAGRFFFSARAASIL